MPPFGIPTQQRTAAPRPPTGGGTTLGPTGGPVNTLTAGVGPNRTVRGEFDTGASNVLFGASSFVDQFLNPSLVGQQEKAIDQLRKTAASRGLSGGAVDSQIAELRQNFLKGNRLTATQGLQQQIQQRLGAFREQISPFANFAAATGGAFQQQEGSVFGKLRARFQATQALENFRGSAAEQSLLGGLESLGLGGLARGEAFRRAGGDAAAGLAGSGLEANDLTALLQGAFGQLAGRTRLSEAQQLPGGLLGRRATEDVNRNLDLGVNRARATQALSGFLTQSLGNLTQSAEEFNLFALGGGADPSSLLGADVSQFESLLAATGLGGGEFSFTGGGPALGSENAASFLNRADLLRGQLTG